MIRQLKKKHFGNVNGIWTMKLNKVKPYLQKYVLKISEK